MTLLTTDEFINAIKISSPSLYCSIESKSDFIEDHSIRLSLLKYALRMSSRAVNYDLLGNISSKSLNRTVINVYFSNEWIRAFLQNKSQYLNLDMTYNRLILNKGDYFFINSYSYSKKKNSDIKIYQNSTLGNLIKSLISKKFFTYQELYEFVKQTIRETDKIEKIISFLLNNSILFIGFDPNHIEKYISEVAKNEFGKADTYYEVLERYKEIKKIYKLTDKKISSIHTIERLMQDILGENRDQFKIVSKNLLYEPYKKIEERILSNVHDIDKVSELKFLRLMNVLEDWYVTIREFEISLVQKYGNFFEISLKRLLEEDPLISEIIFNKKPVKPSEIKRTVTDAIKNIMLESKIFEKNIELNQKFIDQLSQMLSDELYVDKKIYSLDLDLKYQLLKDKIFLTPVTFGFPEHSFISKYRELCCTQTDDMYAYMNIQTNFHADVGRNYVTANNVIDFYGFQKNGMTIDELIIGHDESGIYIKDSVNRKKVIPVFCSVADLSFECENKIACFLQNLGKYIMMPPVNFLSYCNIDCPVLPRIYYKNIILVKRRWVFNQTARSKGQFLKELQIFAEKYKLPNKVCLFHNGEELPIMLDTTYGVDIIYQHFCKYYFVIFTEYFFDKFSEEYFTEYINKVHFTGVDYKDSIDESIADLTNLTISEYETFIIILDKISFDKENLLKIISNYLEMNLYRFFFLYYVDNGMNSIRLRILKSSCSYSEDLLIAFLLNLQKQKQLKYFYFGEYPNELERYGGSEYCDLIHDIFEIDSKISINLLSNHEWKFEKVIAYTVLLFKYFYGEVDEAIESFDEYDWKREEIKNYAKLLRREIDTDKIVSFVKNEENTIKEICNKLMQLSQALKVKRVSRNRFNYVLHSFVHMSFNRKNISSIEEKKMLWITKKMLIKIKYVL